MTAAKGRQSGHGLNFGGARAKRLLARLKQLQKEQRETGRISLFDAVPTRQSAKR